MTIYFSKTKNHTKKIIHAKNESQVDTKNVKLAKPITFSRKVENGKDFWETFFSILNNFRTEKN